MSGFIGVIAGMAEQQKTPAVVPATMHAMQTHIQHTAAPTSPLHCVRPN